MMQNDVRDLFDSVTEVLPSREEIAEGAMLLRGFARPIEHDLLRRSSAIVARSPFRHMSTPGGHQMSVAMTNCGSAAGSAITPAIAMMRSIPPPVGRGRKCRRCSANWPGRRPRKGALPASRPEACLVNRYEPGARLSLHQDRDEKNYDAPIVSVSLGLPATFLWGGLKRADRPARYRLVHGDVVVWGGPSRLTFHGVAPLADGEHALLGRSAINLTFRRTR